MSDKIIRQSAHDKEWKPTPSCTKKLHKLANKRSRAFSNKEIKKLYGDREDPHGL